MTSFSSIPSAPVDPILGLSEAFKNDPASTKINLGVGIYQDAEGRVPILESVQRATTMWTAKEETKAYLPIDGLASYNVHTQTLLFGTDNPRIKEGAITTVQTVGGSGALRVGMQFLRDFFPASHIYISSPSWGNHQVIASSVGIPVEQYPYYSAETNGLDKDGMLETLSNAPAKSIILLHSCCHNPTGVDLDRASWQQVVEICKERALIPFIDCAYQGFAHSIEDDVYPIRLFADSGITFLVANSYAKSFSMYRERCGALSVVAGSSTEAHAITSQLKRIIRTMYSSPPSFGANVVSLILSTPELRTLWAQELETMRLRILEMRKLFANTLAETVADRDFSFIKHQQGMFSFSGLSETVVTELREKHHIYALKSGRICIAALNTQNIHYVCESIATVLKN
jgi:aromatic-amino-acid transaminase